MSKLHRDITTHIQTKMIINDYRFVRMTVGGYFKTYNDYVFMIPQSDVISFLFHALDKSNVFP